MKKLNPAAKDAANFSMLVNFSKSLISKDNFGIVYYFQMMDYLHLVFDNPVFYRIVYSD